MLKRFFDLDNPVMRALSVAADLLVLNVYPMLCCLPVVTAGPAITALNDVLIRMSRGEEGRLTRTYFRAFRGNLKKGVLLGLLVLLAGAFIRFDDLAARAYIPLLRYPIAATGVIALGIAMYAFALLARYENTLAGTLKNAAALAVAFAPRTLGMLGFAAALWVLGIRFYRVGAPILLLFGLALPCYVNIALLRPVFDQLENRDRED